MHDELTQVDIDKMQAELEHRIHDLRPKLIEEVKVARSFGDLSENFEYKAAKREKNRNDSRIRYLQNMIKTAVVIERNDEADGVALFDKVTFQDEDGDDPARHHPAPGCAQGPHQQGVPGGQGPHGQARGRYRPHPSERKLCL